MNIEEKLRGALDTPAPPPTTTLDHVLKRGRRRVFAQRAGAALGVFVVVAGIGIGSTALNHAAPDRTPADQPPDAPATVEHAVGWPRVDVPPQTPYGTWTPASSAPPPAGRPVLEVPQCNVEQRKVPYTPLGGPLPNDFLGKWQAVVRQELPELRIGELQTDSLGNWHAYSVDLTDSGGTGSLRITAGGFEGAPQRFADDALWATGDCAPPYRRVLADGTIVQLHSAHPAEPFQSLTQVMYVFRADGLLLSLELRNWGSQDLEAVTRERVGPGRADLPLTEERFSRLGPAVAAVA